MKTLLKKLIYSYDSLNKVDNISLIFIGIMSSLLINVISNADVNCIIALFIDIISIAVALLSINYLYVIGVICKEIKENTKIDAQSKYEQLCQNAEKEHLNDIQKEKLAQNEVIKTNSKYNELTTKIVLSGIYIIISCVLSNENINQCITDCISNLFLNCK